jgi:hypothetical protein
MRHSSNLLHSCLFAHQADAEPRCPLAQEPAARQAVPGTPSGSLSAPTTLPRATMVPGTCNKRPVALALTLLGTAGITGSTGLPSPTPCEEVRAVMSCCNHGRHATPVQLWGGTVLCHSPWRESTFCAFVKPAMRSHLDNGVDYILTSTTITCRTQEDVHLHQVSFDSVLDYSDPECYRGLEAARGSSALRLCLRGRGRSCWVGKAPVTGTQDAQEHGVPVDAPELILSLVMSSPDPHGYGGRRPPLPRLPATMCVLLTPLCADAH